MNETVKKALLLERIGYHTQVAHYQKRIAELRSNISGLENAMEQERAWLADIELHLRDNGVDLAAVDAEAEKARPKPSALLNGALGYGQTAGNDLRQYAAGLNACNQFDPTAGLAKALDEA